MGHKVNPVGLRLGINRTWDSRWYSDGQYRNLLLEDLKIRDFLHKRLKQAGISKIVIERPAKKARISIYTARPGVVIGKKGQEIEALRRELAQLVSGDVHLNIVEIRKPEIDARLVAENIAQQLERRLGGAEIARGEWYREGRVPLHTLRADVDFGRATAFTPYGTNGVKVWVFKGEILEHDPAAHDKRLSESASVRT